MFVNLVGVGQRPDFHVVPSKVVANHVTKSHKRWLAVPNKSGGAHKDTSMRHFKDENGEYLDRWELLGL